MARRRLAALFLATFLTACTVAVDGSPTGRVTQESTPGPEISALPGNRPPDDPEPPPTPRAPTPVVGRVDPQLAPEVSGIAVGRAVDGLWLVDDEPGTDVVHLVALDGTRRATVRLTGTDTVNIEDLAVGPCVDDPDDSCVHVADIGDNVAARTDVVVLSFPERVASDGDAQVTPTVRRLRLAAPVDAEALVVLDDGTLVVLDRSPDVAGVHVAAPDSDELVRVAEVTLPAPAVPLRSLLVGRVVTAADMHEDGRSLLLRTYDQLLELTPADSAQDATPATWGTWTVTALQVPQAELQGEAAAWLDADRVVTMSEGSSAITVTHR